MPPVHNGIDGTSEYLKPRTNRSSSSYTKSRKQRRRATLSEQGSWAKPLRLLKKTSAEPCIERLTKIVVLTHKIGILYNEAVKVLNTYLSVATAQQMISKLEAYSQALIKLQEQALQLTKDFERRMNRKLTNHNLEALAKQLYDNWLVQFDFPDENGKPYKSSGGKMVWNEKMKSEIPISWEAKLVDDIAKVFNGATPSTADEQNYGGNVVWITPKDLSEQKQKFIYRGERNISQIGYNSCSAHLLPINTILMSSRAPIGLLAIAKKELCTNQGSKNFVPKEESIATYICYYLQTYIKQIEQLGTGTTFKEVSRDEILRFQILKPSDEVLNLWREKVTALNDRQLELQKENENLTKLRDELLPLLMNGQVSVNYDLSHD